MFGSTVLEVAVGLTFCYATVALIVSAVQEALASVLRLRARSLLAGIKSMFNDPNFEMLARALYSHALINPHEDGEKIDPRSIKYKPSYIEPRHFAIALIDTIETIPGNYAQLGRDIDAIEDPQVKRTLQSIYQRAAGDMMCFRDALASWFDSAMERVSGSYKRRSLLATLLLSLLLAMLFNIDSIHLFRSLWHHPALAAQLGVPAGTAIDPRALDALWTLPIGWQRVPNAFDAQLALSAAGWLLTALTALFGAPFWFDMLQRTVRIRGTGIKPDQRASVREPRPAAAPAAKP
jgi:hypothetical protein